MGVLLELTYENIGYIKTKSFDLVNFFTIELIKVHNCGLWATKTHCFVKFIDINLDVVGVAFKKAFDFCCYKATSVVFCDCHDNFSFP